MIKFTNKEGKTVMEMSDKGEVVINDKKLEESFEKEKTKLEENKNK